LKKEEKLTNIFCSKKVRYISFKKPASENTSKTSKKEKIRKN
jgi:hypothetical protein